MTRRLALATGLALALTGIAKEHSAFGRGFRKGDEYQSFPSGHSALGFAAAAVTSETSTH